MKYGKMQNCFVFIFFVVYLLIGLYTYRDYGISTDEPDERESTFINIKYVLEISGISGMDGINRDLENYDYRYYGISMQIPPALFEWINGWPGEPSIWYIRHLWTFFVCFFGYICFYFTCRKVFASGWLALLGTAMIALYPRFFAEQFYNIKDMVFVSMVMVSMFATVHLIENGYSLLWILIFAVVAAFTTNVRIVGVIFPILLLGYLWLTTALNKCGIESGETCPHALRTSILIIAGYFLVYLFLMPILWKQPIRGILEVFKKFSDYNAWNGTIVFMGNILKKDSIPWYYIPVWLLLSLPVWYLLLFVLILVVFFCLYVRKYQNGTISLKTLYRNKYMLWAGLIVFLPWLGTVILHSTLYNAWRHFYFSLPPVVFLLLGGVSHLQNICQNREKNKIAKFFLLWFCLGGLLVQSGWIIKNHPYEMVYLNGLGRIWGADYDRDYWNVSAVGLCRYILEHDGSATITMQLPSTICMRMLTEEERARILLTENPKYCIETFRGKIGNGIVPAGYEDYYSINVDGYRIAAIYKRKDE